MRVILDSNVVMSGVFFGGIPGRILEGWKAGRFELVISPSILAEYTRVGAILEAEYEGVEFDPFAALLVLNSTLLDAPEHFAQVVCEDPDDDKFLACALAGNVRVIVSGDPHLLTLSGWLGIDVLSPRAFVERYLSDPRTTES